MTRPQGGRRTLTLLSAPRFCALCDDTRQVRLVSLAGLRGAGTLACPHCSARPEDRPIPILTLPMRRDVPSGDAA